MRDLRTARSSAAGAACSAHLSCAGSPHSPLSRRGGYPLVYHMRDPRTARSSAAGAAHSCTFIICGISHSPLMRRGGYRSSRGGCYFATRQSSQNAPGDAPGPRCTTVRMDCALHTRTSKASSIIHPLSQPSQARGFGAGKKYKEIKTSKFFPLSYVRSRISACCIPWHSTFI